MERTEWNKEVTSAEKFLVDIFRRSDLPFSTTLTAAIGILVVDCLMDISTEIRGVTTNLPDFPPER